MNRHQEGIRWCFIALFLATEVFIYEGYRFMVSVSAMKQAHQFVHECELVITSSKVTRAD